MVPKWDQRRGYASKLKILLYCQVAIKQEKKPVTGQVMVLPQARCCRARCGILKNQSYPPTRRFPDPM